MIKTNLARALQEDVLVKLGDMLYIPGEEVEENKAQIRLGNTYFSLDACGQIDRLDELSLTPGTQQFRGLAAELVASKDVEDNSNAQVGLLRFALSLFERLKSEMSYVEFLKVDDDFYFPDKDNLMSKYGSMLEINTDTVRKQQKPLAVPLQLQSINNVLIMNGMVYELRDHGSRNDKSIAVLVDKEFVNPHSAYCTVSKLLEQYANDVRKKIIAYFQGHNAEDRKVQDEQNKFLILRKFEKEAFHKSGLILEDFGSRQGKVIMQTPEYVMKIPRSRKYLRFAQASLETKLTSNFNGENVEAGPIMYKSETIHPLVYTEEQLRPRFQHLAGQVCLRELDALLKDGNVYSSVEQLARRYLLNRHAVFRGENLTSFFDTQYFEHMSDVVNPFRVLNGILNIFFGYRNVHEIGNKRYEKQRVTQSYVDKNKLLIVEPVK